MIMRKHVESYHGVEIYTTELVVRDGVGPNRSRIIRLYTDVLSNRVDVFAGLEFVNLDRHCKKSQSAVAQVAANRR
jgi:hypothetical protein